MGNEPSSPTSANQENQYRYQADRNLRGFSSREGQNDQNQGNFQGSFSAVQVTDSDNPNKIQDFNPLLHSKSEQSSRIQPAFGNSNSQNNEVEVVKRAAPQHLVSGSPNKTTAHFGQGDFFVANQSAEPIQNIEQQFLQDADGEGVETQEQWEQQQYELRKRQIIEQLLYNEPQSSVNQSSQLSKKIHTPEEAQLLVNRLLEKGKQIETRNHLTTDYYDQREIENCTFQPNVAPESIQFSRQLSPKRSLQEFLNGQNKFLANREENLRRVQNEKDYQEKQSCSHTPQILQTSQVVMIQPKGRKYDTEPAYKRLFDLQKRKADAAQSKQQQKKEDEVAATKLAAKKSNPKTIDRLYNLGKQKVANKREGKLASSQQKKEENNEEPESKQQKQITNQNNSMLQPSQKESEYCLATKLIKEYEHIVSIVVEDAKKQAMSEIFRLMGFVSFTEKVESHNFVKERTLVNDMWIVLEGSRNGGVSYRNLLLFIFAIMGIDIDLPKFKKNEDNIITISHSKDHAFPLLRDVAELKREEVQDQIDQIQQLRASRISQTQALTQSQGGSMYNISQKHLEEDEVNQQSSKGGKKERQKIDYEVNGSLQSWMSLRQNELRIGSFDFENNMILSFDEVKQIQVVFYLFYVNRLHTEKQKTKYLNSPADQLNSNRHTQPTAMESKVRLSSPEQTEILAQNYRNRMWEQTVVSNEKLQRLGDRIQHADILIAQREEKKKYLENVKEAKKDDELLECTFHPKTNNYTKLASPFSSQAHNFSSQQNGDFNDQNGMLSATGASRPNNNPMPPTSVGTKRYLDLYNLAKPRSQLRDKKTLEVEYEKNCDECTFNPDTGASNGPRQFKDVDVKNKDVAIERMRKAYEENQNIQLKLSRGYYEFKDAKQPVTSGSIQSQHGRQSTGKGSQLKRPFTGDNRVDTGLGSHSFQQDPNSQRSGHSNNFQPHQQQEMEQNYYHNQDNNNYQDQGEYEQFHEQQENEQEENNGIPQFGNNDNSQVHDQQHEQNHPQDENQQNYDWMMNSENKNAQRQPLLFVDINLAADKIERVVVYEGDRPEDLAREFILKHGIDENFHERLTQMLQMQIEANQQQQSQG